MDYFIDVAPVSSSLTTLWLIGTHTIVLPVLQDGLLAKTLLTDLGIGGGRGDASQGPGGGGGLAAKLKKGGCGYGSGHVL